MFEIIAKEKIKIIILIVLSLLIAGLELISLTFMGELISIMMNGDNKKLFFSNIADPIYLAILLITIRPILAAILLKNKINFVNHVRFKFIKSVLSLRKDKNIELTNIGKKSELTSSLTAEIGLACTGFLQGLITVASDLLLTCVLLGLTIYLINPTGIVFVGIFILITLIALKSISKTARYYGNQKTIFEKRLLNHVNSYIGSSPSVSDEKKMLLTDEYFNESLSRISESYGLQQILLHIPKLVIDIALLLLVVTVFAYFTRINTSYNDADDVILVVIVALRTVPILGRSFTSLQALNYTYPSYKFVNKVYKNALALSATFEGKTNYRISNGDSFKLTFEFEPRQGEKIQHTVYPSDGIVCISGPSGVGKTTLLKALTGLNTINNYSVRYTIPDHIDLPLKIDFLMQNSCQFNFDLEDLIGLGSDYKFEDAFRQLLPDKDFGTFTTFPTIDDVQNKYSGGEIERLSVVSSIGRSVNVLLIDEVGSGLDEKTKRQFLATVRSLTDTIILIVSHDEMIFTQADRVIYLE